MPSQAFADAAPPAYAPRVASPHPLVKQLRFTRSEYLRSVRGLSEDDAQRRVGPMNSISWNVGHLAWQEQSYFVTYAQRRTPLPEIERQFASGSPASIPSLAEMMSAWRTITSQADIWLDTATVDALLAPFTRADGQPGRRIYGSLLQRVIYHYWYHLGENLAIRQLLGHDRLPQFVGNIDEKAPYVPEDR
jgi:uncharacterized damage-inducible protein DinB